MDNNKFPNTKLYIKEVENGMIKLPIKIIDFLYIYFTYYKTQNANSSSIATYFDKECTKLHCDYNKMRSFDDIYFIVKTYYPRLTVKGLIRRLVNLKFKKKINEKTSSEKEVLLIPQFSNCATMNKIRIIYTDYDNSNSNNKNYNTIININKYNSVYSWLELLNLININNQDELENTLKLPCNITNNKIELPKNIYDEIKDFNDILRLGKTTEEELLPYKNPKDNKERRLNNIARLQLIEQVYNEDWIIDFTNNNQQKYYPIISMSASSWVVVSGCDSVTASFDGVLAYFKSNKIGLDAANKFKYLYVSIIENK